MCVYLLVIVMYEYYVYDMSIVSDVSESDVNGSYL